jgi:hypothetical protein
MVSEHPQSSITHTIENLTARIYEVAKLEALSKGINFNPSFYTRLSEYGINHFLNEFVLMPKSQIQGITGHFCWRCLIFQSTYIKNIGVDLTPGENHICNPDLLSHLQENQVEHLQQIAMRKESVQSLLKAVKEIIRPDSTIKVSELSPDYILKSSTGEYKLVNFHSPLHVIEDATEDGWTGRLISGREIPIDDKILDEFLSIYLGTYAVVLVRRGEFSGTYLVCIPIYSIIP